MSRVASPELLAIQTEFLAAVSSQHCDTAKVMELIGKTWAPPLDFDDDITREYVLAMLRDAWAKLCSFAWMDGVKHLCEMGKFAGNSAKRAIAIFKCKSLTFAFNLCCAPRCTVLDSMCRASRIPGTFSVRRCQDLPPWNHSYPSVSRPDYMSYDDFKLRTSVDTSRCNAKTFAVEFLAEYMTSLPANSNVLRRLPPPTAVAAPAGGGDNLSDPLIPFAAEILGSMQDRDDDTRSVHDQWSQLCPLVCAYAYGNSKLFQISLACWQLACEAMLYREAFTAMTVGNGSCPVAISMMMASAIAEVRQAMSSATTEVYPTDGKLRDEIGELSWEGDSDVLTMFQYVMLDASTRKQAEAAPVYEYKTESYVRDLCANTLPIVEPTLAYRDPFCGLLAEHTSRGTAPCDLWQTQKHLVVGKRFDAKLFDAVDIEECRVRNAPAVSHATAEAVSAAATPASASLMAHAGSKRKRNTRTATDSN